ncbi:MAG TPA: ATP-binding protein [Ilumatobacteraceae bacterium]
MDVPPQGATTTEQRPESTSLCNTTLAIGLIVCFIYAVAPDSWTVFRELVLYLVADVLAVTSVYVGVSRYRPTSPKAWILIGSGLLMLTLGDLIWGLYRVADRNPFPSPADAFYLASFPLIAAGLIIAVLRRRPYGVDARAGLDAAVLTVALANVGWIYVARPVLDYHALSSFEKVVTILYPCGDLLLFAVAARFVMGSSWNKRALRLLVCGLGLLVIGDTMFALGLSDSGRVAGVWDTILLIAVVLIGVGALDPTMRALTEEAGDPADAVERRLFPFVAVAAMVPPVILLIQEARGEELHVEANLIASLLLIGLLAARAEYMTRRAVQSRDREATLSQFSAEVLAAADRDDLIDAARRALATFSLPSNADAHLILSSDRDVDHIEAGFVAPVMLRDARFAVVVADAKPDHLRRWQSALSTIARQLSIGLEWDRLLTTEKETATALAQQNARLIELDVMKDRFVSSVSHELRTPLTSMMGYLEIIGDGELGELTTEQHHAFDIIDRNCTRLNNLINDILVTSRFDSGTVQLHRSQVDLADVIATEIQSIAAVSASRKVQVDFVVDAVQPLIVLGDENLLSQLVDNFLSNAVKFTPERGTVTVTLTERSGAALIDFRDTGVGIPPDEIDKIFDRFYRASTAATIGGTGLGLSIVKSIAEAHGGSVSVSSEVGVGTTFRVSIPMSQEPLDATTHRRDEVSA